MARITIVGLGLMGTSIGLALRRYARNNGIDSELQLQGYDIDPRKADFVRSLGAVDRSYSTLEQAVEEASLVVLAVPVMAIQGLFRRLAETITAETIVTDTASTKGMVMAWAAETLSPAGISFVGGHPMAGATAGPEGADEALFDGCTYCLTPAPDASPMAVELTHAFARALGARPIFIDPAEHDSYVAAVSHLPFLMAAALMNLVAKSPGWQDLQMLAATGFRDTSRLASGDATMYRDVCLTNREALIHWIDRYQAELDELRSLIEAGQADALHSAFARARAAREEWLRGKPGPKLPSAEMGLAQILFGGGWPKGQGTMRQEGGSR
jgi:prephenate dehydrogenase